VEEKAVKKPIWATGGKKAGSSIGISSNQMRFKGWRTGGKKKKFRAVGGTEKTVKKLRPLAGRARKRKEKKKSCAKQVEPSASDQA